MLRSNLSTIGARERPHLPARRLNAALCLLGLTLLFTTPGARAGGALLLLIGGIGIGRDVRRVIHARRDRQRRDEAQAQHEARRLERRERSRREREQRADEQVRARSVRERERQTLQVARLEETQAHQRAEEARALRAAQIQVEAERLATLDDSTLCEELVRLFAGRGWIARRDPADTANDLRLTAPDNEADAVARLVGGARQAAVADVEAIEALRRDAGAKQSYLIARSGFTPAAIRLAQQFPITLLEPYLLASWKHRDD